MDAATVRLAIQTRNKEIQYLEAHTPVDHLAIEELRSANQRDMRALCAQTTANLIGAAPRYQIRPEIAEVLERHIPSMKGAV